VYRPTGSSQRAQNRLRSGTCGLVSTAVSGSGAGTGGTSTRPAPSVPRREPPEPRGPRDPRETSTPLGETGAADDGRLVDRRVVGAAAGAALAPDGFAPAPDGARPADRRTGAARPHTSQ